MPAVRAEPVLDVRSSRMSARSRPPVVLPDHVGGDALLRRRTLEEEREEFLNAIAGDCILSSCDATRPRGAAPSGCSRRRRRGARGAGRDLGRAQGGALWAVGRSVNPQHRRSDEPRRDDYVFEGYELGDALEAANGVLEDDVRVLEDDGTVGNVKPFTRREVLPVLERFFFGRR